MWGLFDSGSFNFIQEFCCDEPTDGFFVVFPAGLGRLVRLSLLSAGLAVGVAAVPAWAQAPTPLVRGLPISPNSWTWSGHRLSTSAPWNEPKSARAMAQVLTSRCWSSSVALAFRAARCPARPRQERGGQEEERPSGVGSGLIVSSDGFIMTNANVVDGADELLVTLPDKREFKAKVVGADKRTDVAVVKIEALGLPAVKIGDAGRIRVGEWVMAIGSPFGLENSVTAGIVSAKQRDTGDYLPFIQTDVAINPGNSGGPLINMRGEVVGINSQIYSRSGGFMGISFAIPIDEAMRVSEQLRATGKVTRGRIGVSIDQVSKDVAETLGLGDSRAHLCVGSSRTPCSQGGGGGG